MSDTWETVFEAEIDGRNVKGEVYSKGGYKVSTTQKSDYEGHISSDDGSTIIIPPSAAGEPIEIDGESLDELERELVEDGEFSSSEAKKIVGKFNT
ncbi:hypothetical protein MYE70_10220 [Marinobacter alexandrii]|uniref:hypothetical protein n=1 Tax=Marinobacter alexandrii TaxID=2570351 RepID=UPI001FFE9F1F|nr:hypothetical protein [Marinobacter alexandrii]MCK2149441.1 hypothetical protein [Marinobacter alexandrii]